MDLGSITMGAVLTAILILPFIVMSRNTKNREKRLLNSLFSLAKAQNCQISQFDSWSDSAIGLDEAANVIFFYRRVEDRETTQEIKLTEIQNYRVVNGSRLVGNKQNQHRVIDKLELIFSPVVKGRPEIVLDFFDAEFDVQLNNEVQLLEKWGKLVKDRLNAKQPELK